MTALPAILLFHIPSVRVSVVVNDRESPIHFDTRNLGLVPPIAVACLGELLREPERFDQCFFDRATGEVELRCCEMDILIVDDDGHACGHCASRG